MKNLISMLLVVAIFLLPRAAEGQTTLQKTFGGGTGYCVKKTSDGNMIITGESSNNLFLLKMSENGSIIWFKKYTVPQATVGTSLDETADGGFIVGGTFNDGGPTSKVLLLKSDSDGNFLWAKTYGGTYYETGSEVKKTLDGGYVIVGTTISFGTSFEDIYVIKTDSNGNLQWSKTIADTPVDIINYGNSIIQLNDSSYALCGRVYNSSTNSGEVGLIKLDKNGSLSWIKSYGDSGDDRGNSIISTSDGGFAIAGHTESFGAGGADVLLIKTDSDGALQWNIAFGGTGYDYGRFVKQLSDGSFVTGGATESFGAGMYDFYLTKFDSNGIFDWTKTFGGTSYDHGYSAEETSDKGFIMTGFTPSFGPADIYLVKTDSSGYTGCNEFVPNMSMTFASVNVDTPSVIVSAPATIVNSISFTSSNVSTANTLCSLVSVTELNTESFDFGGAKLDAIYDLLGQQVAENLLKPGGLYIYRYYDEKRRIFGSRMQLSAN